MKNALTIDVEDWYQTKDFDIDTEKWDSYEGRVEYNTMRILDILLKHNVKATFFILGYVAGKYPGLVKEISEQGHEIGSHGNWHRLITAQTRDAFREDLVSSKHLLEDITGKEIRMYRASSWSISCRTLWALEILEEEGFVCDSSIQPFKTPLSGMDSAPLSPFYPVIGGRKLNIIEFPSTVLSIGKMRIPFFGGFYLRAFPLCFADWSLRRINSQRPAMLYAHPWEIDKAQPRLDVPAHIKLVHYLNLDTTIKKLEFLISNFSFTTMGQVNKENIYPSIQIA